MIDDNASLVKELAQLQSLQAESTQASVNYQQLSVEHEALRLQTTSTTGELTTLTDMHTALTKAHDQLKTEHTELQAEHVCVKQELEEVKRSHEKLTEDHRLLTVQHAGLVETHQELVADNEAVSEMLKSFADQHYELEHQHTVLKQLHAQDLSQTPHMELSTELKELTLTHAGCSHRIGKLQKVIDTLNLEMIELKKERNNYENEIKAQIEQFQELNFFQTALQGEVVEKTRELDEMRMNFKIEVEKRQSLNVKYELLEEFVSEVDLERKEIKKKYDDLKSEHQIYKEHHESSPLERIGVVGARESGEVTQSASASGHDVELEATRRELEDSELANQALRKVISLFKDDRDVQGSVKELSKLNNNFAAKNEVYRAEYDKLVHEYKYMSNQYQTKINFLETMIINFQTNKSPEKQSSSRSFSSTRDRSVQNSSSSHDHTNQSLSSSAQLSSPSQHRRRVLSRAASPPFRAGGRPNSSRSSQVSRSSSQSRSSRSGSTSRERVKAFSLQVQQRNKKLLSSKGNSRSVSTSGSRSGSPMPVSRSTTPKPRSPSSGSRGQSALSQRGVGRTHSGGNGSQVSQTQRSTSPLLRRTQHPDYRPVRDSPPNTARPLTSFMSASGSSARERYATSRVGGEVPGRKHGYGHDHVTRSRGPTSWSKGSRTPGPGSGREGLATRKSNLERHQHRSGSRSVRGGTRTPRPMYY